MHRGTGPPGSLRIRLPGSGAAIDRVGVDEHAFGSVLLGEIDLYTAKVAAVTHQDDLALDADTEFGEPLEVLEPAVIGVDDRGGDIARGRRSVEAGQNARVCGIRCGCGVTERGAAEYAGAGRVEGLDEDRYWLVHQDAVGDDFGIEARGPEVLGDVERGGVVFWRACPVGRGGQGFEVLLSQPGVGYGEERRVPYGLLREVAEAEDAGG